MRVSGRGVGGWYSKGWKVLAFKLRSFWVSPSQRFKQVAKDACSHILGMGLVPKKSGWELLGWLSTYGERILLKRLGDPCGGSLAMEKDTTLHGTLQWARILVKSNGRKVLATIHMEVGILSFSIHLCWKNLSWVILVYPNRNCTGREVSEDVVGSPHARRNLVLNGESLEMDRGYLLDLGQSLPMTRPHTGDGQWLSSMEEAC